MVHKSTAKGDKKTYGTSFSVIHKAMKKYGIDNFVFNVFGVYDTEEDAYLQEEYWTNYLIERNVILYNLRPGGLGGSSGAPRTNEVKMKISIANKGRMAGEKHFNYGKKLNQELKNKLSEAAKGENNSQSKLTLDDVARIIALMKEGWSNSKLGKLFNVSTSTISHIRTGESYQQVAR
jgi:group I intron endonuclease